MVFSYQAITEKKTLQIPL